MNNYINRFFYLGIILLIISLICFLVPAKVILPIVYDFVCLVIISIGVVKLLLLKRNLPTRLDYLLDLAEGLVNIAVGIICMNFFHNYIVCLIMCIIFMILPVIKLVNAKNKRNQLILDMFKFIFAGLILTSIKAVPEIGKIYSAIVFLALGVTVLAINYFKNKYEGGY